MHAYIYVYIYIYIYTYIYKYTYIYVYMTNPRRIGTAKSVVSQQSCGCLATPSNVDYRGTSLKTRPLPRTSAGALRVQGYIAHKKARPP